MRKSQEVFSSLLCLLFISCLLEKKSFCQHLHSSASKPWRKDKIKTSSRPVIYLESLCWWRCVLTNAAELQSQGRKRSGSKRRLKVSVHSKVKTGSVVLGRRMARLNYCKQADASWGSSPTRPSASSLQDNLTFFISPFHNASAVTQLEKDDLLFRLVLASFCFLLSLKELIRSRTADEASGQTQINPSSLWLEFKDSHIVRNCCHNHFSVKKRRLSGCRQCTVDCLFVMSQRAKPHKESPAGQWRHRQSGVHWPSHNTFHFIPFLTCKCYNKASFWAEGCKHGAKYDVVDVCRGFICRRLTMQGFSTGACHEK